MVNKCSVCGKELGKDDLWVEKRDKTFCIECARPEVAIDAVGLDLSVKPEITSIYYDENRLWMSLEIYGEFPLQETLKRLQELLEDKFEVGKETVWRVRVERLGKRTEPEVEYLSLEEGREDEEENTGRS